jgi:hypothetical protein
METHDEIAMDPGVAGRETRAIAHQRSLSIDRFGRANLLVPNSIPFKLWPWVLAKANGPNYGWMCSSMWFATVLKSTSTCAADSNL